MVLKVIDAAGATQSLSTTQDAATNLVGATCITDPITGQKLTVAQLHNADQQPVPGTAFSALQTGVAQLQDPVSGLVNRQREIGQDNVPPLGIASGGANLAMQFKTTCVQNLGSGVTTMTLLNVSGLIGGVPWAIRQGSKLVVDVGASQETLSVAAVNTGTKVVTFTGVTQFAHNGSVTPFPVIGMTFNQARDAAGENDFATGAGTAVAVEYLWNGGDAAGGNYDRGRSINAKNSLTQSVISGGGAGSSLVNVGSSLGIQAGMKLLLFKASTFPAAGSFEAADVDLSYITGSTAVPLASPIVNAVGYDSIFFDMFGALGPQLNGFTGFGIGIEEEAIYDPVSGKYYIERSATSDAMTPQNIASKGIALWNGTSFDRAKSAPGGTGVVAVSSDGVKATYSVGFTFPAAATPTDLVIIQGSGTKTVRIKRVCITGVSSTSGNIYCQLIRRSSGPTGGTSSNPVAGKHDPTNDPAATAVVSVYTANPTGVGTGVATYRNGRLWISIATAAGNSAPQQLVWEFGTRQDKAVILRGTSDYLCINMLGQTLPGSPSIDCDIEWEEDNS